ncbi:Ground-like domain-containing protein [Meloidogyne graminicola]|uniref:Ground-like domain-containing protein n=1 Tax=Meloidogyne graminicola TaxID=189291 RepID=A0A8T0A257_9BILA|nr:Ground-like domain-containing protein [Meloidogyne graminicola]
MLQLILILLSFEIIFGQNPYEQVPSVPYAPPLPTQPPYAPQPLLQNQYTPVPTKPSLAVGNYEEAGISSFPLPNCYLNNDGFMCCNKELENLMDNTYRNLSRSRNGEWKKCNIHQVAVATQRNAEKHFGVDFELVVGAGDYASKNYFSKDLVKICKIKRENSIILAFATPR